jgi:hypothetical protein
VPVVDKRLGETEIRRYRQTGVLREQIREKLVNLLHYGKNVINFQVFTNGTEIR